MRQQSLPGALYLLSAVNALAYAGAVFLLAALVAKGYWRSLFPEHLNVLLLLGCFIFGIGFAAFSQQSRA